MGFDFGYVRALEEIEGAADRDAADGSADGATQGWISSCQAELPPANWGLNSWNSWFACGPMAVPSGAKLSVRWRASGQGLL